MSKKFIGHLAAAVAVAATSLVVSSGPSSAVDCTQYGTNKDGGFLWTNGAVPYRRAPDAGCPSVGNHEGKAAIWCTKYSEAGNPWYYARDLSSNTVGWVWAGNVTRTEGSNHKLC